MRITGGSARGIILDVPRKGEVRPATDFVRERIFSRIGSLDNAVVWDCFAGTGAYGLEALSRGASKVVFLEHDAQVIPILRENLAKVCKSAQRNVADGWVIRRDVFEIYLADLPPPQYVFFDPPYRFWEEQGAKIFGFFERLKTIDASMVLVLEYPSQLIWPENCDWKPIYPIQPSKKINAPVTHLFRLNR